jgi:hypothetical protein
MAVGPGTTIIVRPQGIHLNWQINGAAPSHDSGADVPSFAHTGVRSFRADVTIGGNTIVGVACTEVRAQLTSGLLTAVLNPADNTITWSLDGAAYAKPGPDLAKTYWPFDLLADLAPGQALEAYVRYGPVGGTSVMQWVTATGVTLDLD